jgi:HPr kinase/phosphorylase
LTDFSLTKTQKGISVETLFNENRATFQTTLLCGNKKRLRQRVELLDIHYPGLALSGFFYHFHYKKIQFVADMEWHYLNSLTPRKRAAACKKLFEHPIPALVMTAGRKPHPELLACAKKRGVPLYASPLYANVLERKISYFLEDHFAPKMTMHASLVDVYGIGLLFTGKSGIGKSECALDLIERGHRLVADDIITITRRGGSLVGAGSPLIGHHMEIRGVGIINIEKLFGIRAIRNNKKIEVIVELVEWNPKKDFDRLGLAAHATELLGVGVDKVTIPIFPGKNITVISEIIAMNMLLKYNGVFTAKEFNRKLIETLKEKQKGGRAGVRRV